MGAHSGASTWGQHSKQFGRRRCLFSACFGLILVITMTSMVLLMLVLFGVIAVPGDGCFEGEECKGDVIQEICPTDDILEVSTPAPVLSLDDQKVTVYVRSY